MHHLKNGNSNMGICLDTEQNNGSQVFEDNRENWMLGSQNGGLVSTPPDVQLPMHNGANVQFDPPKVPVIFVLGGPGSGKVTHCDNLMQEKKGITHINMTDLLQQYAIGNDMQDFSMLSSKTVTEVLMLEMKMAPFAKTYLVSGYPRSMRDVVEYSEKIQVVNGVVLVSWRQKILERQIDYGAKLGQVVLSLARMELNNFYKNVMPVADYFDQNNMLISVHGERHPADVYKDFRAAIFKILGMQDNPPMFANGKVATVPSDVSTEQVPVPRPMQPAPLPQQPAPVLPQRPVEIITVTSQEMNPTYHSPVKPGWPPVLWVIGGPGSNKATLCSQAIKFVPGWTHISLGRIMRSVADPQDAAARKTGEVRTIRESITAGELVPLNIVMHLVESHIAANSASAGIVMDGFPRDMQQIAEFEAKFKQKPTVILLDCSKLQLGRGRLDDSVSAFRRRLEIFRESSLPMLKTMDNIGRLTIVDGDTDTVPVQEDFQNVVRQHVEYIAQNQLENAPPQMATIPQQQQQQHQQVGQLHNNLPAAHMPNGNAMLQNGVPPMNGHIPNMPRMQPAMMMHNLEDDRPIETISRRIAQGPEMSSMYTNGVQHMGNGMNHVGNGLGNMGNGVGNMGNGLGNMGNGVANGMGNGVKHMAAVRQESVRAPAMGNGFVGNSNYYTEMDAQRRENIRNTYGDLNSHI